jgi:hypothetical protein
MRETRPMSTSRASSPPAGGQRAVLWRVGRYLARQGLVGAVRLTAWSLVQSVLLVRGLLAIMASPASSGRSAGEFKDMYQADAPNTPPGATASDGFWRMYFQAYTPRAWRMRRLMPMAVGKKVPRDESGEEEE